MLKERAFLPISLLLLGGLGWWSIQVGSFELSDLFHTRKKESRVSRVALRRDLIEVLDRAVAYQHYYHSVYEEYASSLDRVGFLVPWKIANNYEIRVIEATADRLIIHAYGKAGKDLDDVVSVDQDFKVEANFQVPIPRSKYLKKQALRHLRTLMGAPRGRSVLEDGIYKGYFSFFTDEDSSNGRKIWGIGVRNPVKGMRIELNEQRTSSAEAELVDELLMADSAYDSGTSLAESRLPGADKAQAPAQTVSKEQGQESLEEPEKQSQEEAQLAQIIFKGEVGRFAKSWAELSKVAHFPFSSRQHEAGDWEAVMQGFLPENESHNPNETRHPDSISSSQGKFKERIPLQFEPIK